MTEFNDFTVKNYNQYTEHFVCFRIEYYDKFFHIFVRLIAIKTLKTAMKNIFLHLDYLHTLIYI